MEGFDRSVLGGPLLEETCSEDTWSQLKAETPGTNLEARNTCWWGTLQVSTAQLLRYISPMSLRTLTAGRHGEKKAPILKQKVTSVSVCPHSGLHSRCLMVEQGFETVCVHPVLQELKKLLKVRHPVCTFQRG